MIDVAAVDREITLADLIKDIWSARLFLFVGSVLGFILALLYLWVSVPQYKATMLISPQTRAGSPDISALFPKNASFALEYVARSFGPSDSTDFMRFEHTLRETSVAMQLMEDERIRAGVMQDRHLQFGTISPIDRAEKLAVYLQKNVRIEPVGDSLLKRVVYSHPDRDFAVYLLNALHSTADHIIRQDIRARTENRATYIEGALDRTLHPDHKRVLTSLLMEQEQVRMILAMNEPFAATVAEPPSAGVKPVWPQRPLVIVFLTMVGAFLGYVFYASRKSFV